MIANLSGKVSNETLIEQLPFVEDASNEAEKVKKENLVYTEQGLENDKYNKLTRTEISNPETLAARRNTLKKAVIYSEILGRPRALNKVDFHKR